MKKLFEIRQATIYSGIDFYVLGMWMGVFIHLNYWAINLGDGTALYFLRGEKFVPLKLGFYRATISDKYRWR